MGVSFYVRSNLNGGVGFYLNTHPNFSPNPDPNHDTRFFIHDMKQFIATSSKKNKKQVSSEIKGDKYRGKERKEDESEPNHGYQQARHLWAV